MGGSFHHGGPATFFRANHQQRQHLEMAGLITASGIARRGGRLGASIANLFVARVGQMFLRHEQHGTAAEAKGKHERLGWMIVAAATLETLGHLSGARMLRPGGQP